MREERDRFFDKYVGLLETGTYSPSFAIDNEEEDRFANVRVFMDHATADMALDDGEFYKLVEDRIVYIKGGENEATVPLYATHSEADADMALSPGDHYQLANDRVVYMQK